ncbi:flagellar hook-associated protein 3 [Pseudomonas sp. HR96]|uniref:flagellar hook-associated protein 3 n=1 Tax=Pseudomonas sp. HR96 TaxID=1027966 RepID=UPI002A758243|nr:flagellar hook-associated protein 3 [Pseudomonas sp. HR96]WPP01302.1 flagellar hook-associated protein 3 [Pseudomonas sp. HR96]
MRISTSQYFETSAANYSKSFSDTAKTQEQISSGSRIQTAADDPVGAAKLLQLQQQSSMLDQYNGNITTVTNSLNQSESVLDSINTALQSAQELAVQAGNGGLSDDDRTSIANQLGEIEKNVFALMNSKDTSGNYMFSGSQTNTPPYVQNSDGSYAYQGDQTQLSLQVSDTLSIATNDTGFSTFEQAVNTSRTYSSMTAPATDDGRVNVSAGNMSSQASYTNAFVSGQPYTLSFVSSTQYKLTDASGNDVTAETAANGTLDPNNTDGATVTLRGVDFNINVNFKSSDSSVTADSVIAGHTFTLGSTPDTISANRNPNNTSTAQISSASVTSAASYNSTFPANGAVVKFSGTSPSSTYAVYAQPYGPDSKAIATGAVSGSSVTAAGVTFNLSGTPANGDSFTISADSHKTQNVLDTIHQLKAALSTPVTADAGSKLALKNAVSSAINNLKSASVTIDTTRGAIGARGNSLDIQSAENSSISLANKSTQQAIGDTDMATASVTLSLQQTMLQASQLAFAKISQLSLFSKLG